MAKQSWLLVAQVALVGVLAALAFPSAGSGYISSYSISLTATGPSPSTLKIGGGRYTLFVDRDSVTHTVVFANGRCSLTLSPGEQAGPGNELGPDNPNCNDNFPFYVGSYAYTVDGKFAGTIETVPAGRAVTLTARTHTIRRGTRLNLHGQITWDNNATQLATKAPFPVIVLARYAGSDSFEAIASVAVPSPGPNGVWHVKVRPGVATTYIAEAKGQLPDGRIWQQARSRPFTVRMRG